MIKSTEILLAALVTTYGTGMCIFEPKKYGSPNNSVFITAKSLLPDGSARCFICKARKYLFDVHMTVHH